MSQSKLHPEYLRQKALQDAYLARKNKKTDFYNGIYDRWENPVLTRESIPLSWRFDLNPETNPHFMERLGVNAVFNSGAIKNPAIISAAAQRYGNQCVVLSADIKRVDGKFKLFTKGGRENTGIDALDWLEHGVKNGAGELVVNSIDTDGVKNGFDLELLDAVAQRCAVPIIASGGAGKMDDFKELFLNHPRVDAGLAASIFHTKQVDIRDLKLYLRENGVEMRV